MRHCLDCGMPVPVPRLQLDDLPPSMICPKCDADVFRQHDSRCLSRDIAHQHETIDRALHKLDALLVEGWQGTWQSLRLIVGGGRIREQVLGQLHHYQQRGRLRSYSEDRPNRGAIVVLLR
jgi:hypothetical protein